MANARLLDNVTLHKSIYFPSGWANYKSARKGTLKLSPPPRVLKALEKDFTNMMQEAMFFGKVPDWQLILETIKAFEAEFNGGNEA